MGTDLTPQSGKNCSSKPNLGAKRKVQGWCRACAGTQADAGSRARCSKQGQRRRAKGIWARARCRRRDKAQQRVQGRGQGSRLVQARRAGDLSPFLFFCSAALFLLLGMLPVLEEREG
ncbi:hypothetical protein SLEP1_g14158 [Rubroshorea leprosula]|uniref:Uncharacterized protein n=1 Tax=Rubroshorea leprosula TaxID=152421 RepID=A0AAV5IUN9_9ROSI|nr:hypothetical protein SLEP1_g14158 [Rubroshorea leprosula]